MNKLLTVTLIVCTVSSLAATAAVEMNGSQVQASPKKTAEKNGLQVQVSPKKTAKKNGSSVQASDEEEDKAFDDRSTNIDIVNSIDIFTRLTLVDKGINSGWDSGEWMTKPPDIIYFNNSGSMGTTSNQWLHGAGGWVKYEVSTDGAILTIHWVNPYAGNTSYSLTSDPEDYILTKTGGDGHNTRAVVTVTKKQVPKLTNYSTVIMADPQPWRLNAGGDPNDNDQNGRQWRSINRNTLKSILTHKDVKFHIVNGDLSEYGREPQYNDYFDIYHTSGIPVAEGLGNHDYLNNAHDCVEFLSWGTSKSGCALSAVAREYSAIQDWKASLSQIPGFSFRSDAYRSYKAVGEGVQDDYSGSLSYSWDVGDVHYVQLQNFPTYKVYLSASTYTMGGSADITDSLEWLKDDLNKATRRGKVSIINFHDARPYYGDNDSHFIDKNNLTNLKKFKSIIMTHNVKAIFVGHTHQQAYCKAQNDTVFGYIPVYTAGALFNGDYYLLDVKGKEINVKAYNGKTGTPQLVEDLGIIGSRTDYSDSCSNL